jgi:hypothetical protein
MGKHRTGPSPFAVKKDKARVSEQLKFGLRNGFSPPGGLSSGQRIMYLLDRAGLPYSDLRSFDDFPIPFRCVATDLNSGKQHVVANGSLGEALRATMSLPAVFSPVRGDSDKSHVDRRRALEQSSGGREVKGLEGGVLEVELDYVNGTVSIDWLKVARLQDGSIYSGKVITATSASKQAPSIHRSSLRKAYSRRSQFYFRGPA